MLLSLTRLVLSVIAALALAHAASFLVRSGTLHSAVSEINPDDPRRQLERSLVAIQTHESADVVVLGHTAFIDAVQRSCQIDGTVVSVPIDRANWRDYDLATDILGRLRPSKLIFQARPYLWTDMLPPWPLQKTDLLPRQGSPMILPLQEVRTIISALAEAARGRPGINDKAVDTGVFSFIGTSFDARQSDRFMARISRSIARQKQKPEALFVLSAEEIPGDALPDTRRQVLDAFGQQAKFPGLQLTSVDQFGEQFGCDRDLFRSVALQMRHLDMATMPEIENEE